MNKMKKAPPSENFWNVLHSCHTNLFIEHKTCISYLSLAIFTCHFTFACLINYHTQTFRKRCSGVYGGEIENMMIFSAWVTLLVATMMALLLESSFKVVLWWYEEPYIW